MRRAWGSRISAWRPTGRTAAAGSAALALGGWLAGDARAQPINPARPTTIVVGVPAGARTDRVDTARTGLSRTPLPASGLHAEWRVSAGAPLGHAPLVDARGSTYVVSARGEAIAIARDGTERWRVSTGASDPGPSALLSDDTLVLIDDVSGDALGVREGAVRWRSHVGIADSTNPGPLPMGNGGVVLVMSRDLALLDAGGHERARTLLPEPAAGPLLWAAGKVVVIAASGTVWTWTPGAAEPSRAASFGSPTAGGAALSGDRTLLAVIAGQTSLASVDLLRPGAASVPRAIAPGGLWLGPPTLRGDAATLAVLGPASELAVTVDASGRELARALLAGRLPSARADGGAPAAAGLTSPLLVDPAGTVAFATLDGAVGVAASGAVETLADACPRAVGSAAPSPVVGLAPLPPGSFVVACRTGSLVAIEGAPNASTGGKL